MPSIEDYKARRPAYSVCLIGPAGSGKTQQAVSFPKVYYIGTDPTGLDTVMWNPALSKLVSNLVHVEILNGLPLDDVFANDETSLESLYGNIAHAIELARQDKVRTLVLDNFTYLVDMKWQALDGDNRDKRQAFGQLKTFCTDLMLSRLLPLTVRNGINIVTAIHIQRESKDNVEGMTEAVIAAAKNAQAKATAQAQIGQSKRQINLESDLSPMILGSFRQSAAGMPSAMIYLNNELISGELKYYAYTQKQKVESWDTVIEAKNRYGLPPVLDLTNASLYATLVNASKQAIAARAATKAEGKQE